MRDDFLLFSGTANRPLAEAIARRLKAPLGACTIERFPDGELEVHLDESVRRREVFFVQPTSPPVNDHLLELLAFADACRRAAARSLTAIVPYFGYGRSDKRHGRREPIMAGVAANLMESVGINHLITVDLHAAQTEGFFRIPVDTLSAVPVLCESLRHQLAPKTLVVSPDEGRVRTAGEYARALNSSVVVLHKQRESGTETTVTHVIGDVRDRSCVIIDDMISTGGTIAKSVEVLIENGARPQITVAATHGVLTEAARDHLSHPAIEQILLTDSIAIPPGSLPRLRIVSIARLLASSIAADLS
ncbi:MAG: ribose-phosphate diphosphokinase [Verrucomicrobiota bacterium]